MTETTEEKEKAQQMAERYHSTDFKDLKIKTLESQVTSLTKERDKALVQQKSLEEEVDAISRQLDYEKAAGLAYRKVDVLKNDHAINLNQRYYNDIQELNSLLSKAEEENKELVVQNAKLQEFFDRCLAYEDYIDICSIHSLAEGLFNHFSKKEEALSSLNKEGEEE